MNANTINTDIGRGAIFFDDGCGFCTGMARRMRPTLERRGFKQIGLHSQVALDLTGATYEELMQELYVTAPDRSVHRGIDALLFIISAWPWLRPLCAIARWPGINWILRVGYRVFARNRYRVSAACSIGSSTKRSRLGAIVRWLPLIVLPTITLIVARNLPAWAYMLLIALSIFYACKWLTLLTPSPHTRGEGWGEGSSAASDSRMRADPSPGLSPITGRGGALRTPGYIFLWTGMDARRFMGPRDAAPPARPEWTIVGIKMLIGAAMLFVLPHALTSSPVLLRAWCMMIGLVLLAHFGLFQLIALIWQSNGVHAEALMLKPARSTSLGDLWGRRWNTAFNVLARDYVFDPLRRRTNAVIAMLAVFVVSGLVHDIAICIPARGGYGLPTLYFLIQFAGLLAQRSTIARHAGLGRGVRGWCFTAAVALLPLPLLFHRPFVMNVMLPMLEAIHTLPRVAIHDLPLLLVLAGIMHLGITSAGVVMTLVLDWRRNLASLNGLTRHIIWSHGGFVLATIIGFGVVSLTQPCALTSGDPLARSICAFIALFWGARLLIGFAIFDAKPFLTSRALSIAYSGLNICIAYFVIVYGLAATT